LTDGNFHSFEGDTADSTSLFPWSSALTCDPPKFCGKKFGLYKIK
jgi:hypothetical protein